MELKDQLKAIEDEIREIHNWVSIFESEYDLSKDVVDTLREKLALVAQKVGNISC